MKFKHLLISGLAFGMLGSCSDHDLLNDNASTGKTPAKEATGYIGVQIMLPTDVGTRANDEFNDGNAKEYEVENAMIVLFKGALADGEKKANFYRAQSLGTTFFSNAQENDGITASHFAAIQASTTEEQTDHFWALVILNNNEASTSVITDDDGNTTVKIAGEEFTSANTFEDILKKTTTNSFLGADGESKFFMTNAPLSPVAGGYGAGTGLANAEIQYLTDLGNTVYDTPDEAKTHVSGCIYVERAVAKVTYKDEAFDNSVIGLKFYDEVEKTVDGVTTKVVEELTEGVTVEAQVQYVLSNTNKESYVVRNVEFDTGSGFAWNLQTKDKVLKQNQFRMVGSTPMPGLSTPFHGDDTPLYRTYWCKDPNYASGMTTAQKQVIDATTPFNSLSKTLYCKENTFDLNHMNYGNSTLAVFKVKYTVTNTKNDNDVAENLFIKDGDYSKVYISKESAAADEISRIINDVTVINAMKEAMKADHSTADFNVRDHLDIEIGRQVVDGKQTQDLVVKSIRLKVPANDAWFNEASKATFLTAINKDDYQNTLLANVNALNVITEFTECTSYYVNPIMHFGEDLTPLGDITGTTADKVYAGDNASYLGRYGMVRNNWYEINISEITGLGYATIPNVNASLSDDFNEQKKYFAVEVHLLSWAKRNQSMKF